MAAVYSYWLHWKTMSILVLSHDEVHAMLPMADCIEAMERALVELARGEVFQPLRTVLRPVGAKGFFGMMPAYRSGQASAFGLKEVCVFPGNPVIGLDTHVGAVLLHSPHTGELQGVMNASAITGIRTAAVSAVATRALARRDAGVLAIIGTGAQARGHYQSIPLVRNIREVRVAGRTRTHAEQFVASVARKAKASLTAIACASAEQAVSGADIVVTVTSSNEPVLRREWIAPGTHINLVGSSVSSAREADGATMGAGLLFVDRRESAVNESGDYLFALREGAIGPDAIRAELGEVLAGDAQGRSSDDEITIFKSLGLAIEDLAAAQYLYEKARRTKQGSWVEF